MCTTLEVRLMTCSKHNNYFSPKTGNVSSIPNKPCQQTAQTHTSNNIICTSRPARYCQHHSLGRVPHYEFHYVADVSPATCLLLTFHVPAQAPQSGWGVQNTGWSTRSHTTRQPSAHRNTWSLTPENKVPNNKNLMAVVSASAQESYLVYPFCTQLPILYGFLNGNFTVFKIMNGRI